MIDKYIEIYKEEKSGAFQVLNLASEGSQTAFDAILEIKRQVDYNWLNINSIDSPYTYLAFLHDKNQLRSNFKFFKQYLDQAIYYSPNHYIPDNFQLNLNPFLYDVKSYFNKYEDGDKILNSDFAKILPTIISKTKYTDEYELNMNKENIASSTDYYGWISEIIRRASSFLNDDTLYGPISFGYSAKLNFQFFFLWIKDDIIKKLIENCKNTDFKNKLISFQKQKNEIDKSKFLVYKNHVYNKEEISIPDKSNVEFIYTEKNSFFSKLEVWHDILEVAHDIFVDKFTHEKYRGILKGLNTDNRKKEINEIGKNVIISALSVAKFIKDFLELYKNTMNKDLTSLDVKYWHDIEDEEFSDINFILKVKDADKKIEDFIKIFKLLVFFHDGIISETHMFNGFENKISITTE